MSDKNPYAIIQSGSKQYRVQTGDVIDVELIQADGESKILFKEVLFLNDGKKSSIGAPFLNDCTVSAEVVDTVKGPKVYAFKFKRRKNSHRKVGHRQKYTRVKIQEIAGIS